MGGWKSQKTVDVKLDPATVKSSVQVFVGVIHGFNQYLESKGLTPIELIRPVGSVSYVDVDLAEDPDKVYGDVDYLVSFPVEDIDDATSQRAAENAAKRQYTDEWIEYLQTKRPTAVDVEDTLGTSPLLTIVRLPDGRHVQIDIIITFPKYQDWMSGRYTPERSRKGLIMGKLYKALGDVLVMSIGTEGVIARTRDGQRVPSSMRKNVKLDTISTNIQNFLVDIARNVIGSDELQMHPMLQQNPGLDTSNIDIRQFAKGIVGLGHTLATHDVVESGAIFAKQVADQYTKLMRNELNNPKYKKASTPEQFAMIEKVKKQIDSGINDVDSVLRAPMQEAVLRDYVKRTLTESTQATSEVLLRETIRSMLLTEIGPEQIGKTELGMLATVFSSESSPLGVAVAEIGKLVGSVGSLTSVFLSGIKSFFSSADYKQRYRDIFDNEAARASAIEAKYGTAYAAMERGWEKEGWKIPFMFEPGTFIAVTATQKSARAALDAANAIVGPDWMSDRVQRRIKADQKMERAYNRYLNYDKRNRGQRKTSSTRTPVKAGLIRNSNFLTEQSEEELIAWMLSQPEIQEAIDDSPKAKSMKLEAVKMVSQTVKDLMDSTRDISDAKSIDELKSNTNMELNVPTDSTNPDVVRKAESSALKFASEAAKQQAIEALIGHYQEEGLAEIPSGESIIRKSVDEISKL